MQPQKYQEVLHQKTKRMVAEGIKFLNAGLHAAEIVVEKTVHATRLQYQTRRLMLERYRTFHDLGKMVHRSLHLADTKHLSVTPLMTKLIRKIEELEKQIQLQEMQLSHSTVVKQQAPEEHTSEEPVSPHERH